MKITFSKLDIFGIKKDNLKRIHWFLGEHAFLVMLLLIFLSILIGIFLFYHYVILVEAKKQEVINGTIKFKDSTYQQVLLQWQEQKQMFQDFSDKSYSNPFLGSSNASSTP